MDGIGGGKYVVWKKNIHVILFILFCLNFCFDFLSFSCNYLQKYGRGETRIEGLYKENPKKWYNTRTYTPDVETMNERINQSNKRNEGAADGRELNRMMFFFCLFFFFKSFH